MTAIVCAYCACRLCCGPQAAGLAADGRPVAVGAIAAPRWVPFGTRVRVEGVGVFVVRDRMSRRFPARWDIYMPRHRDAKQWGVKKLNITILK